MSAERSLVPQLEASIRHVQGRRWKAILDDAASRVANAVEARDVVKHSGATGAQRELLRALEDYWVLAEQMREEMGQ